VSSGDFSTGGDWGLFSDDSELTLSNATISDSTYGVQSTLSALTLQNVRITGAATGIHSNSDQSLVVHSSRIENCSDWGLRQQLGNSQLINCLAANNARGFYVESATQANVWNTTLAGNGSYGLYLNAGVLDVRNSIIAGTGTGTGVHRAAGLLASSHNLVYGFATNFAGVTPDDNTLVKSPRFTNEAGGDYRLSKVSPAINAGVDLLGYVNQDILGQARPNVRRWDIGAYEYVSDDASLRVIEWAEKR
jgi:hypothetical protein